MKVDDELFKFEGCIDELIELLNEKYNIWFENVLRVIVQKIKADEAATEKIRNLLHELGAEKVQLLPLSKCKEFENALNSL